MARIEDGMPIRPLPMIVPTPPVAQAPGPSPVDVVQNVGDAVESVFKNVLGGLFGRN